MRITDSPQERREQILEELRSRGKVVAAELSQLYGVSIDTIRRDLRELSSAGLLKRVHGGALPISPSTAPLAERDGRASEAKTALALAARELLEDGQVILFGGGTTNSAIARLVPPNLRATVVTHSPVIALLLARHQGLEVVLIGGRLDRAELVASDAEAVAQVRRFQADICFLGVCSIHPELGISASIYEQVVMTRALIQQSAEVVGAVTADKLGTVAPFYVAPIGELTHIITEKTAVEEVLEPYRAQGIQVIQAP